MSKLHWWNKSLPEKYRDILHLAVSALVIEGILKALGLLSINGYGDGFFAFLALYFCLAGFRAIMDNQDDWSSPSRNK